MSAQDAAVLAMVVAAVVLLVAVLSQGRLKHLLLMMLGAAPKRSASRIVTGLPHRERDWAVVASVSADDDGEPVAVVAASVPASAGGDDDGDTERDEDERDDDERDDDERDQDAPDGDDDDERRGERVRVGAGRGGDEETAAERDAETDPSRD